MLEEIIDAGYNMRLALRQVYAKLFDESYYSFNLKV
jgi:hypothetical protein